MHKVVLTAALALAIAACASEPSLTQVNSADPALGASAAARHKEMTRSYPMGKSAKDRHATGNYHPL